VCGIARQPPKLQDQVRFLDGLLEQCVSRVCRMSTAVFETARRGSIPRRGTEIDTSLGCAGFAYDPAKVEDQVQFLARTLGSIWLTWNEVPYVQQRFRRQRIFFETMSKRRKGFPSETNVKRGVRKVHGDKLLEEKLGRNDLCPCGSGKRFKQCCLKSGRF
jgi:hypothetical protein